MKILITGGCGFLGSNLASYGINNNFDVIVVDNFYREGSRTNFKWLKNIGNNADKDPRITAFIRKSMTPNSLGDDRPGYWITENSWPPKTSINKKFYFSKNKLINSQLNELFLL